MASQRGGDAARRRGRGRSPGRRWFSSPGDQIGCWSRPGGLTISGKCAVLRSRRVDTMVMLLPDFTQANAGTAQGRACPASSPLHRTLLCAQRRAAPAHSVVRGVCRRRYGVARSRA